MPDMVAAITGNQGLSRILYNGNRGSQGFYIPTSGYRYYRVVTLMVMANRDGALPGGYYLRFGITTRSTYLWGAPDDDVKAKVCDSGWVNPGGWPLTWQYSQVNFTTQGVLRNNVNYSLVAESISGMGDLSHNIRWARGGSDYLYGASHWSSGSTGSNWFSHGNDMEFILYGVEVNSCSRPQGKVDWRIAGDDHCTIDSGTQYGKVICIGGSNPYCSLLSSQILTCQELQLDNNFQFRMDDNSQVRLDPDIV